MTDVHFSKHEKNFWIGRVKAELSCYESQGKVESEAKTKLRKILDKAGMAK
jgi:hypothetical protein